MKESNWRFIVDTLLFLCIIGIIVIGILMGLVIPKSPMASESADYFLGLHRHQRETILFCLSIAFVVLVIIHLILSWSWLKSKGRQLFHRGWVMILVLTIVFSLLVLFVFWAFHPKPPEADEDHGVRAGSGAKAGFFEKGQYRQEERIPVGEGKDHLIITGQMTLLDVEKATGIPAREIARELGLPPEVSLNETLGQMRKKYPFTLQEARDVVTELLNKKEPIDHEKKGAEETRLKKEQEIKIKEKEEVTPKEPLREENKHGLIRGRMAAVPSGILITGQMTLYDLEDISGIPARKIADELGIPSNAPLNEHLGRLRKRYPFSMQEVRDVVASLMKVDRKGRL
jgi:hypothetical protein